MDRMNFVDNEELRARLRDPFPKELITKVNKGYGPVDTINHAVVTDRLNRYAPGWTIGEPRFIEVDSIWIHPDPKKKEDFQPYQDGLKHCVAVVNWMQIGDVRRWEIGEAEHPSNYGDEAKKAMSDFIKRAAMRFGVGIDLWTKEDLSVASSNATPGESTVQPGHGSVTSPRADAQPSQEDGSPSLSVVPGGDTDVASLDGGTSTGTIASGEGATSTESPSRDATYIDKDQQRELIQDYGSSKLVVAEFQKHFGDRIRRVADITTEMLDFVNEES